MKYLIIVNALINGYALDRVIAVCDMEDDAEKYINEYTLKPADLYIYYVKGK